MLRKSEKHYINVINHYYYYDLGFKRQLYLVLLSVIQMRIKIELNLAG